MAAITDSNRRNHTNNSACRSGNPFRPIKSFYCPTTLMSRTTRGTNRPEYEWSQGGSRGGATLAHIFCLQPTMVKQMPHTRFPDRMETVFKNTRLTIIQCRLWCQHRHITLHAELWNDISIHTLYVWLQMHRWYYETYIVYTQIVGIK